MFSNDQPRRTGCWSAGIAQLVNCGRLFDAKWLDAQSRYILSTRMCCEGLQWAGHIAALRLQRRLGLPYALGRDLENLPSQPQGLALFTSTSSSRRYPTSTATRSLRSISRRNTEVVTRMPLSWRVKSRLLSCAMESPNTNALGATGLLPVVAVVVAGARMA